MDSGQLSIGEYLITIENGDLWIENEFMEAGIFNKEEFEKMIEKFFKENF